MAKCSSCKQEMMDNVGCTITHFNDFPDKISRARIPNGEDPCHDCKCPPGTLHHPGCDMERCPKCERQALSCGCCDGDTE